MVSTETVKNLYRPTQKQKRNHSVAEVAHFAWARKFNPSEWKRNYSATSNNIQLAHWPLMDEQLHLVQRGREWGAQPAQAPSRCTKYTSAHQSTASVPSLYCCIMVRCSAVLTFPLKGWLSPETLDDTTKILNKVCFIGNDGTKMIESTSRCSRRSHTSKSFHHVVVYINASSYMFFWGKWHHSSIFIARQHTDARYWYSKSVCLSARPSVTFRYQMKIA